MLSELDGNLEARVAVWGVPGDSASLPFGGDLRQLRHDIDEWYSDTKLWRP